MNHSFCKFRERKRFGGAVRDFCTVSGDHYPDAPFCEYCADGRDARKRVKKPYKLHRREKDFR